MTSLGKPSRADRMTAGAYRDLGAELRNPRRHKYGAKHVWLCAKCRRWHDAKPTDCSGCGHRKMDFFASRAEATYAIGLLRLVEAGRVRKLTFQPKFPIWVNSVLIGTYRADFSYEDHPTKVRHVIDVKGMDTPLSKFKRKCVEAQYGIKIEVEKAR